MKKKLLSLALALVMCLGLTVPAFAAEEADGQILKAGDTTFTLGEITFTLSNPVTGQIADDNAITPRSGEIINVVPAGTIITFSPKPDNIDELITAEVVSRDEENRDAVVWLPVEMANVDGGVIDDILVMGYEGDDDSLPIYLVAAAPAEGEQEEAPTGTETPAETPAETEAPAAAPKFTDVAAGSPFAAAIDWAVAEGITLGTTETTFGPSNTCSISNIITFLWRANGKPGAAEGVADRDGARAWAIEQKLIGEDEDVSAPCTRIMAVAYMWRVAGEPEVETEVSFTDLAEGADYLPAVAWAVENGVTNGTSETAFSPDNTCTRGQIVTFLYRADQAAASAEAAE